MAVKFTNNAKTTLASGINSSVTTATVTDGSVFPTLGSGEHFYCTFDDGTNNEIVKVTARSGNTLTIVRGVDNTTARSFSASDAAELRATSALLTDIQENIAAKSANQTVYNTTTASSATDYDIGIDPSVEANAMVFLNGVMQHHDTFSFSGSTLTFDTAPPDGMALEVIVDNLINLQSSNLTVDTFTAADVSGSPQTDFTLSDAPAAEDNLLVFIDGVFQDQDAYTISNQTLTITDGVTADFGVTVYVINPVNIGTPSDGTVTSSKLSGNITMPADLTVTGDVAFDSPTFVVDNANSRVGIGTASPSTLLDIVGDVKMSANLTVDTDTLHVDATNNRVGIGTTNPANKLEIQHGTIGTGNGSNNTLALRYNSTTLYGQHYMDGNGLYHIRADAQGVAGGNLILGGDNSVQIWTGSTPEDRVVVDSSGSLLVNSTSAGSSRLKVVGDASRYGILSENLSGYGAFNLKSTTVAQTWSIGAVDDGSNSDLFIYGGSSAGTKVTLDSSGNVGIGLTNPSAVLETFGGTSFIGAKFKGYSGGKTALIGGDTSAVWFGDDDGSIGTTNNFNIIGASNTAKIVTNSIARVTVDGSGNVGIGTSSPAFENGNGLEIRNSSGNGSHLKLTDNASGTGATQGFDLYMFNSQAYIENYENAPTIFRNNGGERMRIDSSGNVGFSGQLYCNSPNSTLGGLKFFRNHANGDCFVFDTTTAPYAGDLIFGTTNTERMRITSDGKVWIGSSNVTQLGSHFVVVDGSDVLGVYASTISAGVVLQTNKGGANGTDSTTTYLSMQRPDGTVRGTITATGTSGVVYGTTSDYRLKENVKTLENGLDRLKQLKPVEFNWIETKEKEEGFIAHEIQKVFPYAVNGKKDDEKMQSVDYGRITPLLVKAIQEQQEQIETLKQEIREIREGG